mmetsp:Transcript_50889/g.135839  ORF Transcript_50889/g.135839 Transcript_50889/m.135839 type:complete len:101 (-) Transcript_50889:130-432(-)
MRKAWGVFVGLALVTGAEDTSASDIDELIREMDTDRDSMLSLKEILVDVGDEHPDDAADVTALFNKADGNGDGVLDAGEVERMMQLIEDIESDEEAADEF